MYKVILIINVIISIANTESVIEQTTNKNVDNSSDNQDDETTLRSDGIVTSSDKYEESIISSSEMYKEFIMRKGVDTDSKSIKEPDLLNNDETINLNSKNDIPTTAALDRSIDIPQDKITTPSPDIQGRAGYDEEDRSSHEISDKSDGNLSIEGVEVNSKETYFDIPESVDNRNEKLSSQLGDTPLKRKKNNYDYTILDMRARNVENKHDDVSGRSRPKINIPIESNINGNIEHNNVPNTHTPSVPTSPSTTQFRLNQRDQDQAEPKELNRIASQRRSGLENVPYQHIYRVEKYSDTAKSEERTIDDFNSVVFANAYPFMSENPEDHSEETMARTGDMSIFEKLKQASEHPKIVPKIRKENNNQYNIRPFNTIQPNFAITPSFPVTSNFPTTPNIPIKPNIPIHRHFNPYQYIDRFRIWPTPTVTLFTRQ